MKCQLCGQKDATVHLTDLIKGEELHLCDKCAEDQGAVMPTISVSSILGGLIEKQDDDDDTGDNAECPLCESKYSEVRKRGKLGCGQCYDAFASSILPFVERIQGSTEYKGKTPKHMSTPAETRMVKRLGELKGKLRAAVGEEDYELAASIRDEIRQLEGNEQDASQ